MGWGVYRERSPRPPLWIPHGPPLPGTSLCAEADHFSNMQMSLVPRDQCWAAVLGQRGPPCTSAPIAAAVASPPVFAPSCAPCALDPQRVG